MNSNFAPSVMAQEAVNARFDQITAGFRSEALGGLVAMQSLDMAAVLAAAKNWDSEEGAAVNSQVAGVVAEVSLANETMTSAPVGFIAQQIQNNFEHINGMFDEDDEEESAELVFSRL